jgi:hypothetical protein
MAAIILAGWAVAVAAAARSTWSPCGLSMLSTITPLSERSRGHSYRATVGWFVLGATVGGATLGGVIALAAVAVRALGPSPTTAVALALAATVVAGVSDSGLAGVRLPIHRRQVNERWLDRYRPWVYGAGFGWQIGSGLATYITSAAVYLVVVLGALTGRPAVALALGTGFGLLRGLAVLLTRRLDTPSGLRAFHRRFTAAGPRAGQVVVGTEAVSALLLGVSLWSRLPSMAATRLTAAVATGTLVALCIAGTVLVRARRPSRSPALAEPE